MDQTKMMNSMMNMARLSFETGMRSMETFQGQAEKAMELTMKNASIMQDEGTKAVGTWMDSINNARKVYVGAVEEGLSNFEQQFKDMPKPK